MTNNTHNFEEEAANFSWARVSGLSFALALHLAAFMLLMAPPVAPPPDAEAEEVVEVTFIEPPPPPPPPRPPPPEAPPPVVFDEPSEMAIPAPPPAPPAPPAAPQDYGPSEDQSFRRIRPPRYPPQAARQRQEGEVVLRILVSESGEPIQIEIERSSRHRILDRAAMDAVRSWRFNPGMRNGRPIQGWVLVPINFRLSDV